MRVNFEWVDSAWDVATDSKYPGPDSDIAWRVHSNSTSDAPNSYNETADRYDWLLDQEPRLQETLRRLLLDGWAGSWDDLVACSQALV